MNEKFREISRQGRDLKTEERFNLHIGKPYRVQIENCVYDGILSYLRINDCGNTFQLLDIALESGLFSPCGDPADKHYFSQVELRPFETLKVRYFGRIKDEAGFTRVRDQVKKLEEKVAEEER